jgi:NADH-quinone oxidoreductase subunit E
MKIDLESLSAEPLIYMLMHSSAFVAVLGTVFFIIGLLFGYATWGRYKRQTRELLGEAASMKEEIAQLKRKIGDHSIKSGPAVMIATETIHMPRKEGETPAAPTPHSAAPESPLPQAAATPAKNGVHNPRDNKITVKAPGNDAAPVTVPPASVPLDFESAPPPPARHTSPLASIIATVPPAKPELPAADSPATGLVPPDAISTFTELPAIPHLPIASGTSEVDPKLGLVYKERPPSCDDLTTLKGISKILEERLHALGIYTYAQIAAWNEDHVREFSVSLAFRDRIQREQWVQQARQLALKQPAALAA